MRPTHESEPGPDDVDQEGTDGGDSTLPRSASPLLFVGLAIGQGVLFGIFWSVFMAFWMGQPFLQILLGPGLACGVMFGITMGLFFGITMRTSTFSTPVAVRSDFLARLDGEMGKLRYRPEARSGAVLIYTPTALIRPKAFCVVVRFGDGSAWLTGPGGVLKTLKKRLAA